MKNKWFTYLLILLVLLVWGLIIGRIISPLDSGSNTPTTLQIRTDTLYHISSYKLLLNYQEPFLHTEYKPIRIRTKHHKIKERVALVNPNVKYKGLIRNKLNPQNTVVLLEIDNTERYLKVNQEVLGIKLLKFEEGKVLISKEGVKFEIIKSDE
jgi:hypothetical protein